MQVNIAESEKKVAEMAWRDASLALAAAKASRRQAEKNWQEVGVSSCSTCSRDTDHETKHFAALYAEEFLIHHRCHACVTPIAKVVSSAVQIGPHQARSAEHTIHETSIELKRSFCRANVVQLGEHPALLQVCLHDPAEHFAVQMQCNLERMILLHNPAENFAGLPAQLLSFFRILNTHIGGSRMQPCICSMPQEKLESPKPLRLA
jgi:hypothetical protein